MFQLSFLYKYSIAEIEEMIPFERDLYIEMIADELERQEQEARTNRV